MTQPECHLTSSDEVRCTLSAEYALLCMCATFKDEFDKLGPELGIDQVLPGAHTSQRFLILFFIPNVLIHRFLLQLRRVYFGSNPS